MHVLDVSDISYDYVLRSGVTHALNGITARFETGKMYAITGRSGSGKTTLLSLLAAFDRPASGEISLDGQRLSSLDPSFYRRKYIGTVFQSYNLILHLTALENVMIPLELAGVGRAERRKKAHELLLGVGLDSRCFGKRPQTLSGGEQQRVAIARAIATDAPIILADEPTGNLDSENSANIIGILKALAHDDGRCVIIVTHAEEIAAEADVRLHMSDGRITDRTPE